MGISSSWPPALGPCPPPPPLNFIVTDSRNKQAGMTRMKY